MRQLREDRRLGHLGRLCFWAVAICILAAPLVARHRNTPRMVAIIPEHGQPRQGAGFVAVNDQGLLLINNAPYQNFSAPVFPLVLWDVRRGAPVSDFSLPLAYGRSYRKYLAWELAFQANGHRVVELDPPWLILADVTKNAEIRRVAPNSLRLDPDAVNGGGLFGGGSPPAASMAVSPSDGAVAVAYNVHGDVRVYIYNSDLEKQIATWTVPRYVQDLAWSPSGDRLAVLFNGRLDGTAVLPGEVERQFYGTAPGPDVWITDPRSGEPRLRFKTGSNQWQIAFSPNGELIYVIQDYYYSYPGKKAEIGVFSAATGERVRTITAGPRGVHSRFAVSPDGKLIAADASSEVPQRLHLEPIWGAKIGRVALIDAETGRLLFEHHEKVDTDIKYPLDIAFSPDSAYLFVGLPMSDNISYAHVEVFSLDGLRDAD